MGSDSPPIIHDVPNAEYRALPGVSGTQIKTLLTSPSILFTGIGGALLARYVWGRGRR